MSLKLSELKHLHEMGLALIYLRPKEKRPFEKDWTQGPRKKWAELENSFEKTYNLGVRLGEASKLKNGFLACIDVDVKDPGCKEKALKALKAIIGDNKLPTVLSGGGNGSRHLYFACEKPFKQITAHKEKGQWEIAIYSEGRQMVMPGSIHPLTGFEYRWRSESAPRSFPALDVADLNLPEQAQRAVTDTSGDVGGLNFKAEKVDLYETSLGLKHIKMIEDGRGCDDRSAALLSITMAMCRAGLTDNQILSVLSNPDNWIAGAAYEHTQSRDRLRAVKWLYKYTLLKARYETDIMRRFENKPEMKPLSKKEQAKEVEKIDEMIRESLPDLDGNGKPKSTLRNVMHVLEHFMGGGLIGFNEFSSRPYFLKDTEYGGKAGRELSDKDDLALKHFLATKYRFEPSKETCFEAHTLIAHQYRFHPVKSYLEGLKWDGVPRLDSWLTEAFSASGPEDYLAAVSRKVMTAAVARIFEPGCKFDYMLVLEGNQGEGKSMSLGILASRPWFTDNLGDIHNKDVVDQMTGKWIIEIGELAAIRGRENEAVKSFLTRQVDRVRLSYGRRSEDFPRQSIFIGSTNAQEYFTDETGNRRYWPVKVGGSNRKWLKDNRDQLWAEAMVRYELGEDLYLTPELEAIARKEQDKRFEVDEWETEIKALTLKNPDDVFTTTQLWRAVNITAGNGHPPMAESKRIARIMHRLKFQRANRRVDGVQAKAWVKSTIQGVLK